MKLKFKLLIIFFVFSVSISLLTYYVNRHLVPVQLKKSIISNLSKTLSRKVNIENLNFSIREGFAAKGITIIDTDGSKLFTAGKITFRLIPIPSFKARIKLIIPAIHLIESEITLKRSTDGRWNIPGKLLNKDLDEKTKRITFQLGKIKFNETTLTIFDNYKDKLFKISFTIMEGHIRLTLPSSLEAKADCILNNNPISLRAKYELLEKRLFLFINGQNIPFSDAIDKYLENKDLVISNGSASGSVTIKTDVFNSISVQPNIVIDNLSAEYKDISVSGKYKISGNLNIDIIKKEIANYSIKAEAENSRILSPNIPIKEASGINGTLIFTNELWKTENLSANIYNSPATISATITDPLADYVIISHIRSRIPLMNISEILKLDIQSGSAVIEIDSVLKKDKTYTINSICDIIELIFIQNNIITSGNFKISASALGKTDDVKTLKYNGTMEFNNLLLKNIDGKEFLKEADGTALFSNEELVIKNLKGVSVDAELRLSGSVDYKQTPPEISFKINTDDILLSSFFKILPEEIKDKFWNFNAAGLSSLDIVFNGKAGLPKTYSYNGNVVLKHTELFLPYWPNYISNINGEFSFKDQNIHWKDAEFNIDSTAYISSGAFSGFENPETTFTVTSPILNCACKINVKNLNADINQFKGQYYNSSFDITGTISNLKDPYAKISGTIDLQLGDIPRIFPKYEKQYQALSLIGIINTKFDMNGPLKKPVEWNIASESYGENIKAKDFNINKLYVDCKMRDKLINISKIDGFMYNGDFNISSTINLKSKNIPYLVNIKVSDILLQQVIKDTKLKNKKINGTLFSQAVINGYLAQKDSLKGNGSIKIADGYLWDFPVFAGIMQVLFNVPKEYVTLTEALGNFSIYDNRIHTKDFRLNSEKLSLLWKGSMGFDNSLDFNITAKIKEELMEETGKPINITREILQEAGAFMLEIQLKGTTAEPKYKVTPFPVQTIFKDFFEKMLDR